MHIWGLKRWSVSDGGDFDGNDSRCILTQLYCSSSNALHNHFQNGY